MLLDFLVYFVVYVVAAAASVLECAFDSPKAVVLHFLHFGEDEGMGYLLDKNIHFSFEIGYIRKIHFQFMLLLLLFLFQLIFFRFLHADNRLYFLYCIFR